MNERTCNHRGCIALMNAAVFSSAGKKVSSASSDRVTSTGVPKIMVVEMKLSTSLPNRIWKGIATESARLERTPPRAGIEIGRAHV